MEDLLEIAEQMLRDFSTFTVSFGGLEFYGVSADFKELIQLCRGLASPANEKRVSGRAYVFLDSAESRAALAKATEFEAKVNSLTAFHLDGRAGTSQKALLELQKAHEGVVIVEDLPESAPNRRTALERFNSLSCRAVLFSPYDYSNDANLDASTIRFRLKHLDQRPEDKLASIIGLVLENLRDTAAADRDAPALTRLPVRMLATLAIATFGDRVRDLPVLARRICEALRLQIALESDNPLPADELARIFLEFFSPPEVPPDSRFRLWVEGETDLRICKLLWRLARERRIFDLEEGLEIRPLGLGREGGTSRIADVVLSNNPRKNKDLFLLDCDEPGRHGAKELAEFGQDVLLLDPKLACSRCDVDVEIEDFVSIACLDRFYEIHRDLRPEREVIKYKPPLSRRIVVNGADKEALLAWLEANASLRDLDNLFAILCDVRARFSLRNHVSTKELEKWKKTLREEVNPEKQFGARPEHWK